MLNMIDIADALDRQSNRIDQIRKKLRVCLHFLDGISRVNETDPRPTINIQFSAFGAEFKLDTNDAEVYEFLGQLASGYVDRHNDTLVAVMEEIIMVRRKPDGKNED